MRLLRRYQLDIIFLFFAFALIVWSYFYGLKYLGADPHDWEWALTLPLICIYMIILFKKRTSIALKDRRKLTAKTLTYWIALGIILFFTYSTPIAARDYWSMRIFFVIFTLFLADSYWDFTAVTWKNIFHK